MSNPEPFTPNLLLIINKIEDDRKNIASDWLKISTVKDVFKAYHISPKKFRDGYGIPIIEYFISVVRAEKKLGNCPIMSKLVNFLLEKNITPKDVFDICMGLRRALTLHMFQAKLLENNPEVVLDEVAKIFDANLSGVLAIFTDFYSKKEQEIQKSMVRQKKFNQLFKIINFINTKIIIVQSSTIVMGNQSFFEMLDVKNLNELYIKHEAGFSFMNDIECDKDNYDVNDVDKWLEEIDAKSKPFKTNIFHHRYNKTIPYSGRVTTLPDSNPKKYIISLHSIASYMEDAAQMKERLEHDRLTGLYNYIRFEHLSGEAHRKSIEDHTRLALVVVDIPNLKEINREKGISVGDETILNVANDLRTFISEDMILARLEGSRFAIAMLLQSEQESYNWCNALHLELSKSPERKTLSLTEFYLSESVNSTLMRGYSLIDVLNHSDDGTLSTDFEYVELQMVLPDQEKYTEKLKRMSKINSTLYYKGLAIAAENELIYTTKNSAVIQLSNKAFSVISVDEAIYLDFPLFGTVTASIHSIDEKKKTATINNFRLNKNTPLQRKRLRVSVQENMNARLLCNEKIYKGLIVDMNEQYIALDIKSKKNLDEGSAVSLEIMLSIDNIIELFNTEATIYKVQKIKDAHRLVLLCHLDAAEKNLLQKYIANRQMEVIYEIKDKNKAVDLKG